MSFSLFALFFFVTFLFAITFLALANSRRMEEGKDIGNKGGLSVIGAIAIGWILLQTATPIQLFPFDIFIFGFYPFLIAAVALSMYAIEKANIARFWIYLFITMISVALLPAKWLVFQGIFPLFYDRFATAVAWALFMACYKRMDKVPALTFVQTTALCLAFSLFPLFAFRGNIYIPYSDVFSFYPLIVLAALIGFATFKKTHPDLLLGKTGAIPLGYLMGFFLVILAANGFWQAALIMPAYYYFETIYSLINQWLHRNAPEPLGFTFLISDVIRKSLNTKGIFPLLMIVMLGFAMTPIVFFPSSQLMFMSTGILFLYLIYRFIYWGRPRITYKSMFRDTKDATLQVGENVKESLETVTSYIKNKKK